MLKKDRQQDHFTKVWNDMLVHFTAFCAGQKPEDLHRFRVQVKKINALLFFLQDVKNGKKDGSRLQALRTLYKHAGQIRSAHIHLDLIGKFGMNDAAFKTTQEKSVETGTRLFCAKRDASLKMLGRLHQTSSGQFRDIKKKAVLRLYRKRLKKLARFFAQYDQTMEELHESRKKIKMLLYLRQALPSTLLKNLRLNKSYLDKLQDTIGELNDVAHILDLLKTEGPSDGKNVEKLEKRRRRLYDSLWVMAKDFDKKAGL